MQKESNLSMPLSPSTSPVFADVAKSIIKKVFRSAVCIDDQYASAYSTNTDLNYDDPRALHLTFREEGSCDLDIYNFDKMESVKDHMFQNKELLILDWELDPGNKYDSTLKILEKVIYSDKKIPFLLIYTNTEDLSLISKEIIRNFNPISDEKYRSFLDAYQDLKHLCEAGEDLDFDTFKESPDLFFEYIHFYSMRSEIQKEIYKQINEKIPVKKECVDGLIKKITKIIVKTQKIDESEAILYLSYLALKNPAVNYFATLERVEIDENAYMINKGTTLIVFHKSDKSGISPEKLFEAFSNTIIKNPHNFLSLLSLEFKDNLKENFSLIGSKFASLNENSFFYHMGNYKKNGSFEIESIYDFILQGWISELYQQKVNEKSKALEYLPYRYEELKINELPIDDTLKTNLLLYSAYISTTDLSYKSEKKLWFGDIFKNKNEEYFICITPHCDCLRSMDKIKNNFYFVKGIKELDITNALENAEKDHLSFVIENSVHVCIRWKCKPFTSHIEDPCIDKIKISYAGKSSDLTYVTSLKENYAQRISNESFSYGYRVGIDLPHLLENSILPV